MGKNAGAWIHCSKCIGKNKSAWIYSKKFQADSALVCPECKRPWKDIAQLVKPAGAGGGNNKNWAGARAKSGSRNPRSGKGGGRASSANDSSGSGQAASEKLAAVARMLEAGDVDGAKNLAVVDPPKPDTKQAVPSTPEEALSRANAAASRAEQSAAQVIALEDKLVKARARLVQETKLHQMYTLLAHKLTAPQGASESGTSKLDEAQSCSSKLPSFTELVNLTPDEVYKLGVEGVDEAVVKQMEHAQTELQKQILSFQRQQNDLASKVTTARRARSEEPPTKRTAQVPSTASTAAGAPSPPPADTQPGTASTDSGDSVAAKAKRAKDLLEEENKKAANIEQAQLEKEFLKENLDDDLSSVDKPALV